MNWRRYAVNRDTVRLIIEATGLVAVIYSLYLTREALHSGTRPLVTATEFSVSTYADEPAKMDYEIALKNPGTFPAKNVWFEVEMDPGSDLSFKFLKAPLMLSNSEQRLLVTTTDKKGRPVAAMAESIRSGKTDVKIILHYEGMNGKTYKSVYCHIPKIDQNAIPKELNPPDLRNMPTLFLLSDQ